MWCRTHKRFVPRGLEPNLDDLQPVNSDVSYSYYQVQVLYHVGLFHQYSVMLSMVVQELKNVPSSRLEQADFPVRQITVHSHLAEAGDSEDSLARNMDYGLKISLQCSPTTPHYRSYLANCTYWFKYGNSISSDVSTRCDTQSTDQSSTQITAKWEKHHL